jgi:hypothetical protein
MDWPKTADHAIKSIDQAGLFAEIVIVTVTIFERENDPLTKMRKIVAMRTGTENVVAKRTVTARENMDGTEITMLTRTD